MLCYSPCLGAEECCAHAGGMLNQQEAVSQGLLLQQAAMALQMQGASTLFGTEQPPPPDASTQALHAALRQQHYGAHHRTSDQVKMSCDPQKESIFCAAGDVMM